jgi:hypothetical protein
MKRAANILAALDRAASPPPSSPDGGGTRALAARIREALAILSAIRDGQLLASPAAPGDRKRHMTGLMMLEQMESGLRDGLADADPPAGKPVLDKAA